MRLQGRKNHCVAVIGDGAITGGMAYEAMNHAGFLDKNMIVILNDNQQVLYFYYFHQSNHISGCMQCLYSATILLDCIQFAVPCMICLLLGSHTCRISRCSNLPRVQEHGAQLYLCGGQAMWFANNLCTGVIVEFGENPPPPSPPPPPHLVLVQAEPVAVLQIG